MILRFGKKPEQDGEIEKISHPVKIISLLRGIQDAHAHLSVTVQGSDDLYNSMILDVDGEHRHLTLDELTPQDGHTLLLRNKSLHAHTRLNGVDISFAGHLKESGSDRNGAFYRIHLPTTLNHRQRRSAYRARIRPGISVPIYLGGQTSDNLKGSLQDISAGGIGARMIQDDYLPIAQGDVFPHCNIQLPVGDYINCGLEVRFVAPVPNTSHVRIGGRFVGLNRSQEKVVEQFVIELERAALKKNTRD